MRGRAGGRATEELDVAQLRAGGDDQAHDVGGGHATRESRRGPLRARRRKQRERRPRSATCGRSQGSRSSAARVGSGASRITGGLGVQQPRSKRGKKSGCYFECLLFRRTVLGLAEKLAGGRAQRVGAAPTGWAPRLGPSARGPRRRAAPGAHDAPPRGADAPPRSRWFGTKNTRRQGGGWSLGTLETGAQSTDGGDH